VKGYGASVPESLFLFVQMELPWELGIADGRYVVRSRASGEVERVVVLETLGARRAGARSGRGGGGGSGVSGALAARRRPRADPEPQTAAVVVTRTTVIDATPVNVERQASAWLRSLDAEREAQAAAGTLNTMLFAQRIATADPYVREVAAGQALVVRAGWGEGEQVAYGRWSHARELRWSGRRGQRRAALLRPQERLAALLGARGEALLCEELALRARLDLDAGRARLAALELAHAYEAALGELRAEERVELDARIEELATLQTEVARAARAALGGDGERVAAGADAPAQADALDGAERETVAHALGRLEATLRARAAAGFGS
jgi:hypothetical protein